MKRTARKTIVIASEQADACLKIALRFLVDALALAHAPAGLVFLEDAERFAAKIKNAAAFAETFETACRSSLPSTGRPLCKRCHDVAATHPDGICGPCAVAALPDPVATWKEGEPHA